MKTYRGLLKAAGAVAATGVIASIFALSGAVAQAPASKPGSACKGMAEAACKAKSECGWVVPKAGKQKPYCRSKPAKKK